MEIADGYWQRAGALRSLVLAKGRRAIDYGYRR
jgi:hypothetical protein